MGFDPEAMQKDDFCMVYMEKLVTDRLGRQPR
jgi:hypothetical protein